MLFCMIYIFLKVKLDDVCVCQRTEAAAVEVCSNDPEFQAGGPSEGVLLAHGGGRCALSRRVAAPQHDRCEKNHRWSS